MTSRSYIERTLSRFTMLLQDSFFAEDVANRQGLLQQMDPRVKVLGFLALIVSAAFSHSMIVVILLYLFGMMLAAGSCLFSFSFLRRIWIFMPLYTAVIALPALFLTPGRPVLPLWFPYLVISEQGIRTAVFLVRLDSNGIEALLDGGEAFVDGQDPLSAGDHGLRGVFELQCKFAHRAFLDISGGRVLF